MAAPRGAEYTGCSHVCLLSAEALVCLSEPSHDLGGTGTEGKEMKRRGKNEWKRWEQRHWLLVEVGAPGSLLGGWALPLLADFSLPTPLVVLNAVLIWRQLVETFLYVCV